MRSLDFFAHLGSQTGNLVSERRAEAMPKLCVIFASRGRPAILARTVAATSRQSLQPTSIIVSCVAQSDVADLDPQSNAIVLYGPAGLTRQRNTALRHVPDDTDYIVFFDDDFLPHANWLEIVTKTFVAQPDVGSITGSVIADGVKGPGLTFEAAERLLSEYRGDDSGWVQDSYVPYGCNMAFRKSAVAGLFFDERLVLYGWLEDRDFGSALEQCGYRVIKIGAAFGVHMGVKSGRMPGRQLGYSQIVNPVYLYRKGTMPLASVAGHVFRNVSSNLARAFAPERHIDRIGRLQGNLRGVADLARGMLLPERASEL